MMDEKLYAEILQDEIIMESFREMALAQEGQDRIKFMSVVTEAVANPTKQANLLNKLFKDIQKVEAIDFGKIPDSKGDLTKYVYYDQLYDCIEVLNHIVEGHPTPNITSMNKLHQILLDARPDFTFGYRTSNYVIVNMYNLMVTSLYEMVNVCVIDATEYLRAKLSMNVAEMTVKQTRWVTKTVNQFIKMYENGQWNILMKSFKSPNGANMIATEAEGENTHLGNVIDTGIKLLANAKKVPGKAVDFVKSWPTAGKVVGALVAALLIIRGAVYLFFHAARKISDRIHDNTKLLRSAIAADEVKVEGEVEKQKKLVNNLDKVVDTIDYKILKMEKKAEKEMKSTNREEFSPLEVSKISGGDFEF